MTDQEEHLIDHMTAKLTAHGEAESQARTLLQGMLGELATEVLAVKAQLSDLRALTGNQGLAIHHLDEKLQAHVLLARHSPQDVE